MLFAITLGAIVVAASAVLLWQWRRAVLDVPEPQPQSIPADADPHLPPPPHANRSR